MLHEKQIIASKLYAEGNKPTDIAKELGISRQAFYDWLKKEEFASEVDKHCQLIKTQAEQKMAGRVDTYIEELERIAFTGRSEKNRTDALTYLLDRVLGRATTKLQEVTEPKQDQEKELSWDNVQEEDITLLRKRKSG